MSGPLVSLWLDHPKLGCGERQFVVIRAGRKHARLFYWPTLTALTVPKQTLDAAKPADAPARRVLRRLQERRRTFRRLGLADGGAAARDAIAALKESA